jgi:hypothetical protein
VAIAVGIPAALIVLLILAGWVVAPHLVNQFSLTAAAEKRVADFSTQVPALPHVQSVDHATVGIADVAVTVSDSFARVVLDDTSSIETLRSTAQRLQPWTRTAEDGGRVHPDVDLAGYIVTVSSSTVVTEARIALLEQARSDPLIRSAAFLASQPGDNSLLDEQNTELGVWLSVIADADVAPVLTRWQALLAGVAPQGRLAVSVGTQNTQDSYDTRDTYDTYDAYDNARALSWWEPRDKVARMTRLQTPPPAKAVDVVTALARHDEVIGFNVDLTAPRPAPDSGPALAPTRTLEVVVGEEQGVSAVLGELAQLSGAATFDAVKVSVDQKPVARNQ